MKPVRMVDLVGQYEKVQGEMDAAIGDVIRSSAFINGPEVKAFQQELEKYLGVRHAIPCANGTDALQIALMALNLEPGDEVITTDFTFIATVEVIMLLGLKPVLTDVDPETFNITAAHIEKAVTPRTRAVIPVHLFGQCADMAGIMEVAKEHNLRVIEDCAQSIGAKYRFPGGTEKMSGTIGDIGCTSFFPSKNLGAFGDGGAIYTNSDELAASMRMIANHGQQKRYYYDAIGVNSRLDSIQAAVLRVKLKYLDDYAAARNKAVAYYDKTFSGCDALATPARSAFSNHVFHQYTLKVKDGRRDALQAHLEENKIPAMIYYPVPLHAHKAYAKLGYTDRDFPNTVKLCTEVLSLPMHTELDGEQLAYITGKVLDFSTNTDRKATA